MKKKIVLGILLLLLVNPIFCEEGIVATSNDFTYFELINIFLLEMDKVDKYQYPHAVCRYTVNVKVAGQKYLWSVRISNVVDMSKSK